MCFKKKKTKKWERRMTGTLTDPWLFHGEKIHFKYRRHKWGMKISRAIKRAFREMEKKVTTNWHTVFSVTFCVTHTHCEWRSDMNKHWWKLKTFFFSSSAATEKNVAGDKKGFSQLPSLVKKAITQKKLAIMTNTWLNEFDWKMYRFVNNCISKLYVFRHKKQNGANQ